MGGEACVDAVVAQGSEKGRDLIAKSDKRPCSFAGLPCCCAGKEPDQYLRKRMNDAYIGGRAYVYPKYCADPEASNYVPHIVPAEIARRAKEDNKFTCDKFCAGLIPALPVQTNWAKGIKCSTFSGYHDDLQWVAIHGTRAGFSFRYDKECTSRACCKGGGLKEANLDQDAVVDTGTVTSLDRAEAAAKRETAKKAEEAAEAKARGGGGEPRAVPTKAH